LAPVVVSVSVYAPAVVRQHVVVRGQRADVADADAHLGAVGILGRSRRLRRADGKEIGAELAAQVEAGVLLRIGALRERGGDLPQLIQRRIDHLGARRKRPPRSPEVIEPLIELPLEFDVDTSSCEALN
jgi:hypothetical protein